MHPVLFHIGSFTVHTYGVMLMLAFVAGITWAYRAALRRQDRPGAVRPDDVLDAGVWMVLAGIVGARVLFVLLDWGSYKADPWSMARLWEGGVSFHGGLLGGLLALAAFCTIRRVPFLRLADLCAPGAMLGYAIGRVGCFLNGCCYGAPTHVPWAVRFQDTDASGHVFWTPPSHPTQIYATLLSLVFFAGLVWLSQRQAFDGQLTCWYLIGAAVERFVMEIWRADVTSTVVAFGWMTDVQVLCVAMAVGATIGLVVLRRRGVRPVRPEPPALRAVRP